MIKRFYNFDTYIKKPSWFLRESGDIVNGACMVDFFEVQKITLVQPVAGRLRTRASRGLICTILLPRRLKVWGQNICQKLWPSSWIMTRLLQCTDPNWLTNMGIFFNLCIHTLSVCPSSSTLAVNLCMYVCMKWYHVSVHVLMSAEVGQPIDVSVTFSVCELLIKWKSFYRISPKHISNIIQQQFFSCWVSMNSFVTNKLCFLRIFSSKFNFAI